MTDLIWSIVTRVKKEKEAGLWIDPDLAILASEVERLREQLRHTEMDLKMAYGALNWKI